MPPMQLPSPTAEEEASIRRWFKMHIMKGIVPTEEECEYSILKTPNDIDRNYLYLRESYVQQRVKNKR
jgi:hypothetical protein